MWRDLCGCLDSDLWARPYRVVMAVLKDKALPHLLSRGVAMWVLREVFPRREEDVLRRDPLSGVQYLRRLPEENPEGWRVTLP